MGHRFGGSATLGQAQLKGSVPDDSGRCPVQVRVGPTVESQNRGGGGQSLRQDPSSRAQTQPFENGSRQRILQPTV